jgi:hypothetical protein
MTFPDLIGPGKFIEPAVIQASAAAEDLWYPFAAKMPIPENETQPKIKPTQFIYHSMAGPKLTSIEALHFYISRSDINGECTWILDLMGRCAQTLEADTRADNNYLANQRATSVETQDQGAATLEDLLWTDPQLAQLAGLSAWLYLRFGIPLSRPAYWDSPGMDGHRAFKEWSIWAGKTCPGRARYGQITEILIAAEGIVKWVPETSHQPEPPPEEEDMPLSDEDIQRIAKAVWSHAMVEPTTQTPSTSGRILTYARHAAANAARDAAQTVVNTTPPEEV